MNFRLALITVLATLNLANAVRTPKVFRKPRSIDTVALPNTNAKRLSLGLPLIPPRFAGTPRRTAARSTVSPSVVVTYTCKILVTNPAAAATMGYVSPTLNDYSEYGVIQSTQDDALSVTFEASGLAHSQLSLRTTNDPNMANDYYDTDGSLTPTAYTASLTGHYSSQRHRWRPPESRPTAPTHTATTGPTSKYYESAIWSYDPTTKALTAQWVNSDGTSYPATIMQFPSQGTLRITGNPHFADGNDDFSVATLTCV
ncbi:hypothetical protein FB451DRAFT_1460695 [Mycena latifolia]|nr:hypothetical protein FB451DRAFT_1460695 [Mycena latifolia]